jgi:zinc transport system substrate-binding protein
VADVQDADVVIEMGRGFQPAVERAARRAHRRLAALEVVSTAGHENDPHAWLDPNLMAEIATRIATLLGDANHSGRARYAAAVARYRGELAALDGRYRAGLAACIRHEVVTSHEAFGWLAARYGLRQVAVTGLNPEAEPTPGKLAEMADLVRRDGVTTVFTETLLSPRSAQALAREAGVTTAVLDPLEGLTKKEEASGANYISIMDQNLTKLRAALGCR